MASEAINYTYAYIVLYGIWIPAFLVIWIVSLFLVRRRRDPARWGFTWLKIVLPLALLSSVLVVAASAMAVARYFRRTRFTRVEADYARALGIASDICYSVGNFATQVESALLLVTFVELGNGFMFTYNHQPRTYQSIFRWISYFIALVLVVLAIASCATFNVALDAYYYNRSVSASTLANTIRTSRLLGAAHSILTWIASLATIAYAAVAVHFWKQNTLVRSSAVIFLVGTILHFIRYTWWLAYVATYVIPILAESREPRIAIVEAIFEPQFRGVTLVLLFVIGLRKANGLWTTQQPFHNGVAPVAWGVATAPSYLPKPEYQQQQPQPVFGPQIVYAYQQPPQQGYYYPPPQPHPQAAPQ